MLARCFLSLCVRLYARLSVRHKPVCIETTEQIELVSGTKASFSYPTLYYQVILVSPKIRVLPPGTLSHTPDFKKFRHGKSIALSTKLVVVDDRAC